MMWDWISENIIALVALSVSGIAAYYSYRQRTKSNDLQEEQTELQRRVVNIEEQREQERLKKETKARLRPVFKYIDRHDSTREIARQIKIENIGKVKAYNIRMFVDGDPLSMHRNTFCRRDDKISPIQAGNYQMWRIEVDEESPEACEITLKWDDETGIDYEFKDKLSLRK